MPGPPPNPNARRRNDKDAWRIVPAVCERRAPAWPLTGRKPAGLVALWRHLWTLPVAELWHEQNAVRLVARYALVELQAERDPAETRLAAEARQIEDRLLISPSTRIRARVVVADGPEGEAKQTGAEVSELDAKRAARLAAG